MAMKKELKKSPQLLAARKKIGALWEQWTKIVELFAYQRPQRKKVQRSDYEQLYAQLLEECSHLEEEGEEIRGFCATVDGLVRPWLECDTFLRADREILVDLLQHCQDINIRLGIKTRRTNLRPWIWLGVLTAAASVAGLLIFLAGPDFRESWLQWFRRQELILRAFWRQVDPIVPWAVTIGIGVFFFMYLLSRARRD